MIARTKEPQRRKATWQPATVTRAGWELEAAKRRKQLPDPPDIPPRPTGSQLRQRRWDSLYSNDGTEHAQRRT